MYICMYVIKWVCVCVRVYVWESLYVCGKVCVPGCFPSPYPSWLSRCLCGMNVASRPHPHQKKTKQKLRKRKRKRKGKKKRKWMIDLNSNVVFIFNLFFIYLFIYLFNFLWVLSWVDVRFIRPKSICATPTPYPMTDDRKDRCSSLNNRSKTEQIKKKLTPNNSHRCFLWGRGEIKKSKKYLQTPKVESLVWFYCLKAY